MSEEGRMSDRPKREDYANIVGGFSWIGYTRAMDAYADAMEAENTLLDDCIGELCDERDWYSDRLDEHQRAREQDQARIDEIEEQLNRAVDVLRSYKEEHDSKRIADSDSDYDECNCGLCKAAVAALDEYDEGAKP